MTEFDLDLLTSFDARSPGGVADGVLSTEAGVRTFRQLVLDGLVSRQVVVRVTLRLEPDTVVITDVASGSLVEHIPLSMIGQVSQLVGDPSATPFDNILIYTVLEDSFHMAPPEMYFFQCRVAPVSSRYSTSSQSVSK